MPFARPFAIPFEEAQRATRDKAEQHHFDEQQRPRFASAFARGIAKGIAQGAAKDIAKGSANSVCTSCLCI